MLKYFGTPLVEEGPCSVDPGQHAPQGEPEGEPEGEPKSEPEGEPERGPEGEPEGEPKPEGEGEPESVPEKGAEPEPEGKHSYPEPEPEPEREETFIGKGWKRGKRRRGSQVPRPEPLSRDPNKKVYFIGS